MIQICISTVINVIGLLEKYSNGGEEILCKRKKLFGQYYISYIWHGSFPIPSTSPLNHPPKALQ